MTNDIYSIAVARFESVLGGKAEVARFIQSAKTYYGSTLWDALTSLPMTQEESVAFLEMTIRGVQSDIPGPELVKDLILESFTPPEKMPELAPTSAPEQASNVVHLPFGKSDNHAKTGSTDQ